jgi:hypothetical protein
MPSFDLVSRARVTTQGILESGIIGSSSPPNDVLFYARSAPTVGYVERKDPLPECVQRLWNVDR